MMLSLLSTVFVACLAIQVNMVSAGCDTKWGDTVLITALLPLHSGANCSQVNLRAVQQLAAIKDAIKEVNTDIKMQDGLSLSLQVQDTCGTPDGAMRGAMRALVDSQQTCIDPPLFLGILGPEDSESLSTVKKITSVFNITHVLPYPVEHSKQSSDGSVLFVTLPQHKEHAEAILTIMHEMQWQQFSLVYDTVNSELAKILVQLAKLDPSSCLTSAIALQDEMPKLSSKVDGVVFLIDSPTTAASVLDEYDDLAVPIIVSVNKIGLRGWQVPQRVADTIILQQSSVSAKSLASMMNSTLLSAYQKEQLNAFQKIHCKSSRATIDCLDNFNEYHDSLSESVDASATPWSHAVRLLGSGLRVTHRIMCRAAGSESASLGLCKRLANVQPSEWRTFLQRATAFARSEDDTTATRLRFNMDLSTSFDIFLYDSLNANLEKIGKIKNGKNLLISPGYALPIVVQTTKSEAKCESSDLPMTVTDVKPKQPEIVTISDVLATQSEYGLYELIGMLCGAAFLMVAIMSTIIYIVYKSFKVKSNQSSGKSSPTSSPTRGSTRGRRDRNSSVRSA